MLCRCTLLAGWSTALTRADESPKNSVTPERPGEFALSHWDRDVFTCQPARGSAGGPAGVCFSMAPGGQADRVLIENLNISGQGAFVRVK